MGFHVTLDEPWLIAHFDKPQSMLSWSITRPGFVEAKSVAWLQVQDSDLSIDLDPVSFLNDRLQERGASGSVGLLTSSPLRNYQHASCMIDGVKASCVVTFGLSNGLHVRASDSHEGFKRVGTINLLCHVSQPLAQAAQLEALSIATQARTAAVLEADYYPPGEDLPVTGTGTDCIVMACPKGTDAAQFAGLHTAVGKAVGTVVYEACKGAAHIWLEKNVSG